MIYIYIYIYIWIVVLAYKNYKKQLIIKSSVKSPHVVEREVLCKFLYF